MDDVLSEARGYRDLIKATVMIAEKISEAGVEVLEVDREMVVLRGDLYPPHISKILDTVDVDNTEKVGLIDFKVRIPCSDFGSLTWSPVKEFQLLTNACGGMTFLQVLNIE
jgi:hypothetical protein